ncbi:YiaA/YiaB family inner membrane protein [Tsukamurella sp. 8F]|uniref:YiaA/YiaB family inner membrane protein n=1 Tax=unclassified Tsukamurella TaxID=2633480 RepID=UPI0023BA3121|nr:MULTISPECIES: YiaA/YiaB family inner membrane protein [unclassified Tsukamurella]MDF0531491.1 YiaA/YiaB family inner membrane protein [Tsukamurella sp. 8J]MDF0588735.1 YiaA/YiaB family inner membrane protein [Tsukamurella sp. 8F]
MSTTTPVAKTTAAFYIQSVIAFAVSSGALVIGAFYLPMDPWQRGFLVVATLFLITSCFNLAKVIRDREEANSVRVRIDEARMDRLIAEHDPLRAA